VNRAVYGSLRSTLARPPTMERLHIFNYENIPQMLAENLTDQIRPLRPEPRRLDSYSPEEQNAFPKLFDYPTNFVLPDVTLPPPLPAIAPEEIEANIKRQRKRGRYFLV